MDHFTIMTLFQDPFGLFGIFASMANTRRCNTAHVEQRIKIEFSHFEFIIKFERMNASMRPNCALVVSKRRFMKP
jgi:hypothetical protein